MEECLKPIEGISLQLYAELVAKMRGHEDDLEACARIAELAGIDRRRWFAAMSGWNARMSDPNHARLVSRTYIDFYHAAVVFEDEGRQDR